MIDVRCFDGRWVVEFPITLCCPIAGFVLWLYLHRRINRNIVDVELVLRRVDVVSEVRIVLTIVLFLWVLWIRVPVVG